LTVSENVILLKISQDKLNDITWCRCFINEQIPRETEFNMQLLQTSEFFDSIANIVHRETQEHKNHLDLTVSEVHVYRNAGDLDFGGSEFKPATTDPVKPEKNDPEDDYGWWKLKSGIYKAVFNEKIKQSDQTTAFVSLHEHAKKAGILSNEGFVRNEENGRLSFNFFVPEPGCNIKENARMASLYVLK